MSRGPGRWQRAILERLETVPAFYQFELFPSERARRKKSSNPDTRFVAARRATRTLPMRARFVCSITAATARLIAGW